MKSRYSSSAENELLSDATTIRIPLNSHGAVFRAYQSQENTEFLFELPGLSEHGRASRETTGITFARDAIVFRAVGSQIQMTASNDKLRTIFSEILNRKIFTPPVFQTNVSNISPYIEPIAAIIRRLVVKMDGESHTILLRNTMLHNLIRHIAYVWPNTNSPELSLSPTDRPPLALRLALDYIYSSKGMVKSVNDVASQTNVGLRALEKIFRDRLRFGIKRYCKFIMLRKISEQLKSENQKLSQVASDYGVSNISRLRNELIEYEAHHTLSIYPWEIYDLIRIEKYSMAGTLNLSNPLNNA